MLLTAAQIVAAADLPSEIVPVPEWGGEVKVRAITAAERDAFEESNLVKKPDGEREFSSRYYRARLVALALVDDAGRPLFDPADVEQLAGKSARAMERVFNAAARLAGMTADDIKELEKN